jgi:hypothetical protein
MVEADRDTLLRIAAFDHVRGLSEVYDHLTANELKPGFVFDGERIPLINPQRGIFKPKQMRFLLSIKTVFSALLQVDLFQPTENLRRPWITQGKQNARKARLGTGCCERRRLEAQGDAMDHLRAADLSA